MDKRLLQHAAYIKQQIASLEKSPSPKHLAAVSDYHRDMVHNFQHERLIHLIVTFFFIPLTLALLFLDLWIVLNNVAGEFNGVIICLSIIVAILAVTSVFYVRHYYRLENGTEKLYDLTRKLYDLSK
jgi:hypothetical protein